MNVSELRLGGLSSDHHHASCFRRDEPRDGEGRGKGRKTVVFMQEGKTFCKSQ